MISGIAGYLKSGSENVKVVGCSPKNSPVMAESVRAKRILEIESKSTLSDGTAGGVEQSSITFDLCQRFVDDWVLVSEEEIADAIKLFVETHHMLIEGAAGVAVAACLKRGGSVSEGNTAVVVCGANIEPKTLKLAL